MNSFLSLSCPGKVFILGEYSCLEGGLALVVANKPRFSIEVFSNKKENSFPFDKNSPAALLFKNLLKEHSELQNISFKWSDPYLVPIGVGSSSAQFILLLQACFQFLKIPIPPKDEILQLYWNTIGTSQGIRPSGVDVLIQHSGGAFAYSNKPYQSVNMSSCISFWNKKFLLAFTQHKTKTHDHLIELKNKGWPQNFSKTIFTLNSLTASGIEFWNLNDAPNLGKTLTQFQETLNHGQLAPPQNKLLFEELSNWDGVLGCKGSGAQGGDCILFLIDPEKKSSIENLILKKNWVPIQLEFDLKGLECASSNPL